MKSIPITVGVIGHRDVKDIESYTSAIKSIFNDLRETYPNSPLVLFSQLAEGADTFVAEKFLELKAEKCLVLKEKNQWNNCELHVPLPFQEDEYTKYYNDNDKKVFNSLIDSADKIIELNHLDQDLSEDAQNIKKQEFYRNSAEFVADSSLILIALFDTSESKEQEAIKKGGTRDTVFYKKNGYYKDKVADEFLDNPGELIIIDCERESREKRFNSTHTSQPYLTSLLNSYNIKKALENIELLNKNIRGKEAEIHRSIKYLHNIEGLKENYDNLAHIYGITDVIAVDKSTFRIYSKYILAFIISIYSISAVLYEKIGIEPALLFAIITIFATGLKLAKPKLKAILSFFGILKNYTQFSNNRRLAEGLRVQFYWSLSGLNKKVTNYFNYSNNINQDWLKSTLDSIIGFTFMKQKVPYLRLEQINDLWIKPQRQYFYDNINKLENKQNKQRNWQLVLFTIGFLLLVSAIIIKIIYSTYSADYPSINNISPWLMIIISIVFVLFSTMGRFFGEQESQALLEQYRTMLKIFKKAEKVSYEIISNNTLTENDKIKELQKLYYLIGKEAIAENMKWNEVIEETKPIKV